MMIRFLFISLLSVSGIALALEPLNPAGFLPTEIARPLLEQDPGVAAARGGLDVALNEAGILDKSPYEWTTRATGQQRRLESGPRYNEWHVSIEQTLRLPGKAAADRNLGTATVEESQARYGEALHEAARDLMTMWLDWLAAERARELAEKNLLSMQASLGAVEKRIRAGDASKLDLSIARAELSEQKRLNNDVKTQATTTWLRLSTRFPGIKRQLLPLPTPLPIADNAASMRERILAESDVLKGAQAQMRMAQAHAERARAEKTPDPTLGVFTASEVGGRERISGIMISIPIPGGARNLRSAKAAAALGVSYQEIEMKKRLLETEVASAIATADGAYESLQIANEGASAMQENAALMHRAYTLGEAELQAMLLSNRQATAASNNALQAQLTALKGYFGLLVDAHLIWDLAHD
ncbi:TolC family protein [Herminiimonas sp. NPDC097707]|uniref:TolC family protein n=1 Tax=Herminiimonas sp. NPDC097707 TaxID=3364007 RepID=UPI00383ABE0A